MSDNNILEYNIATKIAKLIQEYGRDFDYIQVEFVDKSKQAKWQNIFILDYQGKLLNGKKI